MEGNSLKVAVIAPPFTAVPPKGHGGTERCVYELVEGLTKRGHKVILFGAGNCKTSANFIKVFKKTIDKRAINPSLEEFSRSWRIEAVYLTQIMENLIEKEKDFDIIFNYSKNNYLFLPLSRFIKTPIINILELPLFKEAEEIYSKFRNSNIVTVSYGQRKGFSKINYLANIYNGTDLKKFEFCEKPKDYFLFLGAMALHKNPKDAILAAKRAKVKLILAGGKIRGQYFPEEIKPLIDGKKIRYVGEIDGKKKKDLLKNARALLLPIKWPEPFGLVMTEAMACGTPVIAYPNGSAPEIIENGKTGFLVKNIGEMVEAIKKINKIDRRRCRERVEKLFSTEKMAEEYEMLACKMIEKQGKMC